MSSRPHDPPKPDSPPTATPLRTKTRHPEPTQVLGDHLLTVGEAARRLGVKPATVYDWLGRSRIGELVIQGQRVTIDYYQTGPRGQGRIKIEAAEVERVRELMRVKPQIHLPRQLPVRTTNFPGITVPLGRPSRS